MYNIPSKLSALSQYSVCTVCVYALLPVCAQLLLMKDAVLTATLFVIDCCSVASCLSK